MRTGAEDPHQATKGLAEAVRSMPEALVWGQSDVVQTGFALLADFRGEHDLANELLETTANRDFVLLGFTIEHRLEQRGQTSDEDWLALATEFWSRVVPDDMHAGATSVADLLERWQSGAQGLPTAAP